MGYNIYFELVSSIFLVLMLGSMLVSRRDTARHSAVFRLLVFMLIITGAIDIVTAMLIDNQSLVPIPLNITLNTLYFMIAPCCAFFFLIYVLSYDSFPKKAAKVVKSTAVCSLVVYQLLCLINIRAGFIFTFKDGFYAHGPLVLIAQGYSLAMVIIALVLLFAVKKTLTNRQFYPLVVYSPLIVTGALVQTFVVPKVLLTFFVADLAAFIIFLFLETPDYQKLQKTLVQLSDAEHEAVKANNAKSDFLSQMSHEIRTPINAVLGMN